jgi:hypothetical protein
MSSVRLSLPANQESKDRSYLKSARLSNRRERMRYSRVSKTRRLLSNSDVPFFVFSVTSILERLLFLINSEELMFRLVKLVVSHSRSVLLTSLRVRLRSIWIE